MSAHDPKRTCQFGGTEFRIGRRLTFHPLVPTSVPIYGYIYDVTNGRLIELPDLTKVGQAA